MIRLTVLTFIVVLVDMSYGALQLRPYNETALAMFLANDFDHNGVLTLAELESSFDKYDVNGDGRESRHEYTEYVCATSPSLYQLAHYLFDEYDVNGDHHLEKVDYDALFATMDADHDSNVTAAEFILYWEKITMLIPAIVATALCSLSTANGASLSLKPYNETAMLMFMGNDLDLDGRLTRAEIRQTFRKYDVNDDGIETRYEYTEYICATSHHLYQLSHYLFDEYDLNGDHKLEPLDHQALFDNMDTDKNDEVSPREFINYWERIFPKYENVEIHEETTNHGNSTCH